MERPTSLINLLTYELSGSITRPLYLEYNSRKKEIARIWAKPNNRYQFLQEYETTVDALLAISLFYRYVMGHIEGASTFYTAINKKSGRDKEVAIHMGNRVYDMEQHGHLLSAVIAFQKFQDKYQLAPWFYEYSETVQFLKNCKDLFYLKEYEEDDSI
jgi:hypothetical protein